MGATNIQVAVRVRPFLPFEAGSKSCIDVLPGDDENDIANQSSQSHQLSQGKSVRIGSHHAHRDGHTFTFDRCFSGKATQMEIYSNLVLPLLNSCLEGYNATTLAYGQTGAGEILFLCVRGWVELLILQCVIFPAHILCVFYHCNLCLPCYLRQNLHNFRA